jgi:hypothetical protein
MLGLTEARLPGDSFSLIDPLDPEAKACDVVVELTGHRHYLANRQSFFVGQSLALVPEPENKFDVDAIRVEGAGQTAGYINRLQARSILRWIERGVVDAHLLRLNGSHDRPRAFAFLRARQTRAAAAA